VNKLLVISYFANIDALAPSHHIDDRLAYLNGKADVILLSSPCGKKNRAVRHTRVPSPAPSGYRYELRYFLRRSCATKFWRKFWEMLLFLPVLPLYLLEKIMLRLDSTWSWFLTASIAAWVLCVRHKPKAIYSTGGPVSAHLAAMFASRLTGIPYFAEFQDPLVHQYAAPGKLERLFMKDVERLIFKTANRAVFLTKKAAGNAVSRHGGTKAICVYAGGLPFPKAAEGHNRGLKLRIAHFGSLGGSRNLDCFLDALEELIKADPGVKDKVVLELYGHSDRNVMRRIERFGYEGIVKAQGKIKRSESLGLMTSADVLLLIQNTDPVSFETIPSKTYEYLHANRPILALAYRNPELKAMLEEYGHVVREADDMQGVKEGLKAIISLWEKGALEFKRKDSAYTVEAAVDELLALFFSAGIPKKESGQAPSRSVPG